MGPVLGGTKKNRHEYEKHNFLRKCWKLPYLIKKEGPQEKILRPSLFRTKIVLEIKNILNQ